MGWDHRQGLRGNHWFLLIAAIRTIGQNNCRYRVGKHSVNYMPPFVLRLRCRTSVWLWRRGCPRPPVMEATQN